MPDLIASYLPWASFFSSPFEHFNVTILILGVRIRHTCANLPQVPVLIYLVLRSNNYNRHTEDELPAKFLYQALAVKFAF